MGIGKHENLKHVGLKSIEVTEKGVVKDEN